MFCNRRTGTPDLPPGFPNRQCLSLTLSLACLVAATSGAGIADDEVRRVRPVDVAPAPASVSRYVDSVFERRDLNGDRLLSQDEWETMNGDPHSIDQDQDGLISKSEFETRVVAFGRARGPRNAGLSRDDDPVATARDNFELPQPTDGSTETSPETNATTGDADPNAARPAARETRFTVRRSRGLGNLPGWFLGRDADGDGQLTLREFIGEAGGSSREFDLLDRNSDGVVTPREVTAPREVRQPANP